MGEQSEQECFGQDLLSEALGQSGLNLDDYLGNVPGNFLSQAMLPVGDFASSEYDFLSNLGLSGNFTQPTPYIVLSSSDNAGLSSNVAVVGQKSHITGVQQTLVEQCQTRAVLSPQETFHQQSSRNQKRQAFPSTPTVPGAQQRLQTSNSAPLLESLLSYRDGTPASATNLQTSESLKKELSKK